jgi:nucleotide-binding universal stress UspA family protein
MTYANILLHLDATEHSERRIEFSAGLAADQGAHLVGLACIETPYLPAQISHELGQQWIHERTAELTEQAQALCQRFEARLKLAGSAAYEARHAAGSPADLLALHGRYSDLIVLARPSEPVTYGAMDEPDTASVLMGAGRPVLLVPGSWRQAPVGRRIALAWSETRESARAASDALPLLRRAGEVDVLVFNARPDERRHGAEPGADIATFLARHGVRVTVHNETSPLDVGNALLSRLADLDSDLLVMGAYGHARLREMVLGGVTRTVLRSSPVPVLMSH